MVTGGNATVYIKNMDAAVAFYTEVLGMKLSARYGDHWATVEAGQFTIGLHPQSEKAPAPGTAGSIQVGLLVEDIEAARSKAASGGALQVGDVVKGDGGSFVNFQDPCGNQLYFWQMPKWD
ncbi:MAG: VOC family protein [Acidobacteriaceae bacterium]